MIIRAVGAAAVARTYYVARRSILWNMYAARHTDRPRRPRPQRAILTRKLGYLGKERTGMTQYFSDLRTPRPLSQHSSNNHVKADH